MPGYNDPSEGDGPRSVLDRRGTMKPPDTTLSGLRLRRHQALFDALGPVGFMRFMQQFVARGDSTKDREQWISKIDLSDFRARLAVPPVRRRRETPR